MQLFSFFPLLKHLSESCYDVEVKQAYDFWMYKYDQNA